MSNPRRRRHRKLARKERYEASSTRRANEVNKEQQLYCKIILQRQQIAHNTIEGLQQIINGYDLLLGTFGHVSSRGGNAIPLPMWGAIQEVMNGQMAVPGVDQVLMDWLLENEIIQPGTEREMESSYCQFLYNIMDVGPSYEAIRKRYLAMRNNEATHLQYWERCTVRGLTFEDVRGNMMRDVILGGRHQSDLVRALEEVK